MVCISSFWYNGLIKLLKEIKMKSVKRIFLATMLAFAAVLLVACGSKNDNGTYVFEPTAEEAKEMMPSELQSLVGDDYKVKLTITIKDDKADYKTETEIAGKRNDMSFEYKVDQKAKKMEYEQEGMKAELTYEISGDVLTFKDVKNSVLDNSNLFSNFMKVAKFKKVK